MRFYIFYTKSSKCIFIFRAHLSSDYPHFKYLVAIFPILNDADLEYDGKNVTTMILIIHVGSHQSWAP